MISLQPGRRVSFDGEDRQRPHLITLALACQYADSSTANPVNPQGTAGGGNVFNAGSIFGTVENTGTSSGADGAGTGSEATAALGGSAQGAPVAANSPAAAASSVATQLLSSPAVIYGAVAVVLFFMLTVAWHFLKKK